MKTPPDKSHALTTEDEATKRIQVYIPASVYTDLRVHCVRHNVTLSEYVARVVANALKKL